MWLVRNGSYSRIQWASSVRLGYDFNTMLYSIADMLFLFVQAGLFYEYSLTEQQSSFKVNLNVLMECLGIFGSGITGQGKAPTLKMMYDGYGEPLVLTLEDGQSSYPSRFAITITINITIQYN